MWTQERYFLRAADYVFTVIFALEMIVKVISSTVCFINFPTSVICLSYARRSLH